MKKNLLALAAVMSLAIGAHAQTTKAPPMKPKTTRSMPMRDPKTGRFMKKPMSSTSKMHAKGTMKKTMPMRDPKTGRFIKKKG